MKPPPAQGTGGGGNRFKRSGSILISGNLAPRTAPVKTADPWKPLDGATLIEVRRIWWTHRRRFGVRLPAQRGVIVIDGGRP